MNSHNNFLIPSDKQLKAGNLAAKVFAERVKSNMHRIDKRPKPKNQHHGHNGYQELKYITPGIVFIYIIHHRNLLHNITDKDDVNTSQRLFFNI